MAIHVHCPSCHQRLTEKKTYCTHCEAPLPPGVLFSLAAAHGERPVRPPMVPERQPPIHLDPRLAAGLTPPFSPASDAEQEVADLPALPMNGSPLRPWLAALLSIVCGLGQLYNGQVVKGMVLIVLATAAVASLPLLIGKILLPLLWIYAIGDAFIVSRRAQTG